MRNLSLMARRAMAAQETGEVFVQLIVIDDPAPSPAFPPIFFTSNTDPVTYNGDSYVYFPFDILAPDQDPDTISRIRLSIDNADRRIGLAVRQIQAQQPARFTLTTVRLDPVAHEVVEGPYACTLRNTDVNAVAVAGDLWPFEDIENEPFPCDEITPATFPGVFA